MYQAFWQTSIIAAIAILRVGGFLGLPPRHPLVLAEAKFALVLLVMSSLLNLARLMNTPKINSS